MEIVILKHQGKKPITTYEYYDLYSIQLTEEELISLLHLANRHHTVADAVAPTQQKLADELERFLLSVWNASINNAPKVFEKFKGPRRSVREGGE